MASQLRVDEIIASTGSSVAIGTAGESVTISGEFSVDTSKGLNVGTGATIFSPSSNVLTLGTNNAERVRIDSSGNVGIGTDNPTFSNGSGLEVARDGTSCIRIEGNNQNHALEAYANSDGATLDARGSSANLMFDIGGSEKLRITSSGNIGIGTVPQSWSGFRSIQLGGTTSIWSVEGGQAGSSFYSNNIYFDGSNRRYLTNNSASEYIQDASTGNHIFYEASSGTAGNTLSGYTEIARFTSNGLKVPSGAGIDFSATSDASGMTSELLDDYEEGTWVPRLSGTGGGDYTPGGNNVGYYVKVGNLVKVSCTLHWTAQVTAYTGNLVITGLPYASRTTYRHAGTISAISSGLTLSTNYNRFSITHDPSASQAYIIQNKTDGNGYAHSAGTVATSGLIYSITWTYVTT